MTKTATVHAQQRWEYMCISRKTETYLAQELGGLGFEGWELVTVNYVARGKKEEMFWTAFLKRPASGHAAPPVHHEAAPARHDLPSAGSADAAHAESLQGFEIAGDTFAIHEEEKKQEEPKKQEGE